MSAPLPDFWTEEKDAKGRTYFSNHRTQETTWKRPVASAPQGGSDLPPPYGGNAAPTAAAAAPPPQAARSGPCCTPRLTFWISCALGWVVWVFAVAASADDKWAKIDGFNIGAGDEDILDDCDSSDDVCSLYKAFTAMQFIAAVVVSVSMVLFTLALFRPAAGLKCCSVKSLAIAAGSLMIAFAFFEMLAFVLIIVIEKELDGETNSGFGFSEAEADLGATFGVAVVAVVLGVVQAVSVLTFARSSGDGPFFKCFNDCMAMNNAPNAAAVPTQQQQPQPLPQQQQQQQQQQPPLRTAVFASAASTQQAPAPAPTGPTIPAAAAPVPAEPASTAV
ncbi:unnamed protein product [Ectocarpus fasciculatus]